MEKWNKLICTSEATPRRSIRVYLHLLSLPGFGTTAGSIVVGAFVRSSKFIIINEMSSTSLFMGAITSEHRNFDPETRHKHITRRKFGVSQTAARAVARHSDKM